MLISLPIAETPRPSRGFRMDPCTSHFAMAPAPCSGGSVDGRASFLTIQAAPKPCDATGSVPGVLELPRPRFPILANKPRGLFSSPRRAVNVRERSFELTPVFWFMASYVQAPMKWTEQDVNGALLTICRKALQLGCQTATTEQLACWAGVDRDVIRFVEYLRECGFVEADAGGWRIAMVAAHFARVKAVSDGGRRGGKRTQEERRTRGASTPPSSQALSGGSREASSPPSTLPLRPPLTGGSSPPSRGASSQASTPPSSPPSNLGLNGEVLSGGAGGAFVSDASPSSSDSQENSELSDCFDASDSLSFNAASDGCLETSHARAREGEPVYVDVEAGGDNEPSPEQIVIGIGSLPRNTGRAIASSAATEVRKKLLLRLDVGAESLSEATLLSKLTPNTRALVSTQPDGAIGIRRDFRARIRAAHDEADGSYGIKPPPRAKLEEEFEGYLATKFKNQVRAAAAQEGA